MLGLIIGGSGSGKSEYAETRILELGDRRRIYLATMKPWDEECKRRIKRHRLLRAEKEFETIECYSGLESLVFPQQDSFPTAVLLECMSNLVSNELFCRSEVLSDLDLKKKILKGITGLTAQVQDLLIVTNEVFSDGDTYSPETNRYRKLLGEINQELGDMSDWVVEAVVGIPIFIKGEEPERWERV